MNNGLKGKVICYTNDSGASQIVTIRGAAKFSIQCDLAINLTINIWTASQEKEGAQNGQLTYKQAWPAGVPFSSDATSKQPNSDYFEDFYVEIPDAAVLYGFVWGHGSNWYVS